MFTETAAYISVLSIEPARKPATSGLTLYSHIIIHALQHVKKYPSPKGVDSNWRSVNFQWFVRSQENWLQHIIGDTSQRQANADA